jgi:FkbM family methyltransferase
MRLQRFLAKAINGPLLKLGFQLKRQLGDGDLSLNAVLTRARARGVMVKTVIDVGASDGRWSEAAMRHFPDASYLLVEAHRDHEAGLERFKRKHPNADYALVAAGDRCGEAHFKAESLFGGSAATSLGDAGSVRVPMMTLDALVTERQLPPPFLIKLDTHGFELPILNGAASTLARGSLLIIEAYNLKISPEALLFHELCAHLERLDYRTADLCEPLHRPSDKLLWQVDLIFERSSSAHFADTTYH